MRQSRHASIKLVHRHAWLWEPLESDPSFVLGSMFGTKVAYLDGRLVLCFTAREEPWRGVLVCTERTHHEALMKESRSLRRIRCSPNGSTCRSRTAPLSAWRSSW